ncbi:hemicentin-1-like [Gigantopelta aegis]|uniref:hemicentin-1-like n=1 Tax=Gigantopelta aegis TaxID=1735272 RepID=UPI001B88C3CD|nr:hemicentin-1-like [Gigantopelta aegis]
MRLLNNTKEMNRATNSREIHYSWTVAHVEDTGNYSCTADNGITDVSTKKIQLFIQCSPRLDYRTTFVSDVYINVGNDTALTISVIAYPEPVFDWYKLEDDQWRRLVSTQDVTSSSWSSVSQLVINNTQWNDTGVYQVIVVNDAGSSEKLVKNITLTVIEKTTLKSQYIGAAVGTVVLVLLVVLGVVIVLAITRKRTARPVDAETMNTLVQSASNVASPTDTRYVKCHLKADDEGKL